MNFLAIISRKDNPMLPIVLDEFNETVSFLFDPQEECHEGAGNNVTVTNCPDPNVTLFSSNITKHFVILTPLRLFKIWSTCIYPSKADGTEIVADEIYERAISIKLGPGRCAHFT